jgi:hypothetical protein
MFPFCRTSGPAVGPTQPAAQWVPGAVSAGTKRPGMKLSTQLHLVSRLGISGAVPLTLCDFMVWAGTNCYL